MDAETIAKVVLRFATRVPLISFAGYGLASALFGAHSGVPMPPLEALGTLMMLGGAVFLYEIAPNA